MLLTVDISTGSPRSPYQLLPNDEQTMAQDEGATKGEVGQPMAIRRRKWKVDQIAVVIVDYDAAVLGIEMSVSGFGASAA